MKKAKKLLSLVLVLALAMSLMSFASAKPADKNVDDYSDFDTIKYTQAVDVLTALGVITGYEDNSFGPTREITRAEAAKIITYIMIGKTAADRLGNSPTSFSDVETISWANPFIEYCAANGVINGYGDGRFGPNDNVTAAQMAKMLLIAIGYGAKDEYVGTRWELNAIVDGQNKGILTTGVDYTAPATREEVAAYTFNTLTGPWLVTYNSALDGYYNGNEIWGTTSERQNLGERTFRLYKVSDGVDAYGYSVHVWKLNTIYNANSLTEAYRSDITLGTSTNGIPLIGIGSLTSAGANFIAKLQEYYVPNSAAPSGYDTVIVEYYVNGTEYYWATAAHYAALVSDSAPAVTFTVKRSNVDVTVTALRSSIGLAFATEADFNDVMNLLAAKKGVIVNLVDRNFDGHADKVVMIVKDAGVISAAPSTNSVTGATTLYGVVNSAGSNVFPALTLDYPADELKVGDVVLFHTDGFGTTHVEIAKSTAGQLTKYTTSTRIVTFGGTTYTASGLDASRVYGFNFTDFTDGNTNFNANATAYFDDNGSIVAIVLDAPAALNYLVLTAANRTNLDYRARVIFADGSVETIYVETIDIGAGPKSILDTSLTFTSGVLNGTTLINALESATGRLHADTLQDTNGAIFTYTKNTNGTYNLKVTDSLTAGTANTQALYGLKISQKAYFLSSQSDVTNYGFVGDDATIFITVDGNGVVKSYTGVKNVPLFTAATTEITLAKGANGVVRMVYIAGSTATSDGNKLLFINPLAHPEKTVENGAAIYTTWVADPASTDGSYKKEVRMNQTAYDALLSGTSNLRGVVYDSTGLIVGLTAEDYDGDSDISNLTNGGPIGDGSPDIIRGTSVPTAYNAVVRLNVLIDDSGLMVVPVDYRLDVNTKIFRITQGQVAVYGSDNVSMTTGVNLLAMPNCDFYVTLADVNDNLVKEIFIIDTTAPSVANFTSNANTYAYTYDFASETADYTRQAFIDKAVADTLANITFDASISGVNAVAVDPSLCTVTTAWDTTTNPIPPAGSITQADGKLDATFDGPGTTHTLLITVIYGGQSVVITATLTLLDTSV